MSRIKMGLLHFLRLGAVLMLFGASTSLLGAESGLGFKDPTMPLSAVGTKKGTEKNKQSRLELNGVFTHENRKTAIVAGRKLELGDLLNGLILKEIHGDRVVLEGDGEVKTLYLYPSVTKKKNARNTPYLENVQ